MKKTFHILLPLLSVLCTACNEVALEDRLHEVQYVAEADIQRTVVIEDYTGQDCRNCPEATEVINTMVEAYGHHVIPVAFHAGNLSMGTPLHNATAQHYFLQLGDPDLAQPTLRLNRQGVLMTGFDAVKNELARRMAVELVRETPVNIQQLSVNPTAEGYTLSVTVASSEALPQARLLLWILEDGITSRQVMPDGSRNRSYVHNHVFRTAVTRDADGDAISLHSGEGETLSYPFVADAAWQADNLILVAIVADADGAVMQAQATHFKK